LHLVIIAYLFIFLKKEKEKKKKEKKIGLLLLFNIDVSPCVTTSFLSVILSLDHFLPNILIQFFHSLSLNFTRLSTLSLSFSFLGHTFPFLSFFFFTFSLSIFLVLSFSHLSSQNSSFTLYCDLSTIPIHPPLTFTSSCMNNQNPLPHHPVDRNLPDRHPNPTIGETLYIRECEQRLVTTKQKYSDLVTGKIKPNPRDYPILKATWKIRRLEWAIWRAQNRQENLRHFIAWVPISLDLIPRKP